MRKSLPFVIAMTALVANAADPAIQLITLDPGHFHASLVQKFMYPQVSPVVHVYAPEKGADLNEHLNRVDAFNTRAENPTKWEEKVYVGKDFLQKMCAEKAGNVVVIAGNNIRKTEYIERSVESGFNVLADKPMAINPADFERLRKTFELAKQKNVLVYDIMTERYEITSMLQRELAHMPEVFGSMEKGTTEKPAVVMESVHHVSKTVSGKPVLRPPWFFDPLQQGEAVPDVGTHLVDLAQWECFPDRVLNWKQDVKVQAARQWPTILTPEQFKRVSGLSEYPEFLKANVENGNLKLWANGEVSYRLHGVQMKVTALWNFEAPAGGGDTHYSLLRGTKANLIIKQGAEQSYKPTLYVERLKEASGFEVKLRAAVAKLAERWPGVGVKPAGNYWEIVIPAKYSVGHEAHFTQVADKYLKYLSEGKMPEWETAGMLTKYHITTEAYRLSHAK